METSVFQGAVRQQVRARLPILTKAIKQDLLSSSGPSPNHLFGIGDVLRDYALISAAQAPRVNDLVVALYKNEDLDIMVADELQQAFSEYPRVPVILSQLAAEPASVSEEDFQYAIQALVQDDRFLFKYMRAAFSDPAIRTALGIPTNLDIETYIQRLQGEMLNAHTWGDLVAMRADGEFLGSFACGPEVCVAAVVLYAVATVVQTVVGAVAYIGGYAVVLVAAVYFISVSTAGVDSPSSTGFDRLQGPCRSYCINSTSKVIWILGPEAPARKRFPLSPGKSSLDLGLPEVYAILVGGQGNQLTRLHGPSGEIWTNGAYFLNGSASSIAGFVVAEDEGVAHVFETRSNELRPELQGYFLTSDQQQLAALSVLSTHTVAAAYPPGFDPEEIEVINKGVQRYYRSHRAAAKIKQTAEVLFAQ